MPARHFCFCLPLRLGAFLVSLCQLIFGGLLAAANWYAIESLRGRLPGQLRGTIASSAIYHTLLAIAALIGLFGTIKRNAGLLSTYSRYLGRTLAIRVILDIIQLILFFSHSRQTLIRNCIDGSTNQEVKNICDNSFDASKWSLVASMIIGLLIQSWAAYIVASYANKIENEKSWRSGSGANVPLASSHAYPYDDASHSFGSSMSHHHVTTSV